MTPKITVFMAAYNAALYIAQAIESILNQTFGDFELLIVNDGSTDNTVEIVKTFTDPRIRLIENDQNMGLAFTRNIALKEAKGEFLAVLDSDDIAFAKRLEIQFNHFLNRPKLAVSGGCAYVIDNLGHRTGQTMIPICDTNKLHAGLLFYNSFVHSTVMIRMSALRETGGYPLYPIAEDYALFSRIALKHQVDNISEYLIEYRLHGNNISLQKASESESTHLDILTYQLGHLLPMVDSIDLNMLLTHVYKSNYSIKQYYELYRNIILQNRKIKLFPVDELEYILFKNWFAIIMEKGTSNTFFLYFRRPLFNRKFITAKHIRKVFKQSIKYTFR